jgi:hypothetical protein
MPGIDVHKLACCLFRTPINDLILPEIDTTSALRFRKALGLIGGRKALSASRQAAAGTYTDKLELTNFLLIIVV